MSTKTKILFYQDSRRKLSNYVSEELRKSDIEFVCKPFPWSPLIKVTKGNITP